MAAKLTRLTHKIAIQLHLVAESSTFAVLALGDQSGNFWLPPRIMAHPQLSTYFIAPRLNFFVFKINTF
jgi:hypothetical protein